MRVVLLQGLPALAGIVPAWEDLAASALEPNPFYEPWMLLPALSSFGEGGAEVATVWDGGRLMALVPLARRARLKAFPVPTLSSWRHPHCLLCTPLVRAGREAAGALAALLDWMAAAPQGAAALELRYLVAGGAFHAALSDVLLARGLSAVTIDSHSRAVLRRAPSGEAYIAAALSPNTRRGNAKREKRLRTLGQVGYRMLAPADDARPWIDEFLALEAAGWKGRAGSALACSEPNRRFACEVLEEAHRRGRLLMSSLDLDGRSIAGLVCLRAGAGAFAFKTAYDEAFSDCGPGVLVEVQGIRDFHAQAGLDWMDSFTDAGNSVIDRLWKDRLVVQSLAVGVRWSGRAAAAALPLASVAKRALRAVRASAALPARVRSAPARPLSASAA